MVGSLNADLVVRAARAPERGETVLGIGYTRHPGGKGANQACAAARVAAGQVQVALIGRVGADAEGQWLRRQLEADGVDISAVGIDDGLPTGIAAITVEASGDNRIVVVPGANQALTPGSLSRHHDTLAAADVLLLQLEIPLPTVQTAIRMGREKRAIVILDPAPARPLPDALLPLVDYLTPNESELAALAGPGRRPRRGGSPAGPGRPPGGGEAGRTGRAAGRSGRRPGHSPVPCDRRGHHRRRRRLERRLRGGAGAGPGSAGGGTLRQCRRRPHRHPPGRPDQPAPPGIRGCSIW